MDDDFIALDNKEYFDKVKTPNGTAYVTKNYPGPIAIDSKVSECRFKGCRTLETRCIDCGRVVCTRNFV